MQQITNKNVCAESAKDKNQGQERSLRRTGENREALVASYHQSNQKQPASLIRPQKQHPKPRPSEAERNESKRRSAAGEGRGERFVHAGSQMGYQAGRAEICARKMEQMQQLQKQAQVEKGAAEATPLPPASQTSDMSSPATMGEWKRTRTKHRKRSWHNRRKAVKKTMQNQRPQHL